MALMLAFVLGLGQVAPQAALAIETGRSSAAQAPLPLTGRVVDAANVLTPAQEASLTRQLQRLEQDTKVQFVVATTPSLGGKSIAQYGLALGNAWGVGDKVRNDGLILLLAPNDRKVRIEVGKGLETVLTDPFCTIVVQHMLPRFRAGNMSQGIQIGVDELSAKLQSRVKSS